MNSPKNPPTRHRFAVLTPPRRALPRLALPLSLLLLLPLVLLPSDARAADGEGEVVARGAESYGPVTPVLTVPMRSLAQAPQWRPGDPIKEVPRRVYPAPGQNFGPFGEGLPDPLLDLQLAARGVVDAPTIDLGINIDAQGFTGATPPDTVGDVGPNHYVHAVNASSIAIFDKDGNLLPGYPIQLDSLAPGGSCTSGFGDPIVLYDWLADRWFLQEFTGGGDLCIYVSTSGDPTGTYNFYEFTPPSFPDYPHYGVWPDAYYAGTNEGGSSVTTYAFDRVNMLAGSPATMQRLTVVPAVSGYGFQLVTPADHDGDPAPPVNEPGIFMRHFDDEAHGGADPADDFLEIYEMSVDWTTPANTTVTALPSITIADFNSWFVNYTTFFSVPQPSSSTLLDPIREAILQRLVYRNFGSHETLLGVFPTNRDPATSGSNVEAGNRWFELRRSGGGAWSLFQEGTFGGDTNSPTANFFVGSVAMDGAGNIAMGYSKTDVGASPVFPSIGFTGRLESDPAGVMGPENDIVLGVTSQSGSGRWGDYANLSVDPADDCTFWFTTEYMPGGSWGTRLSSWTFQECLFGFILTPTPAQLDVCAPTDPDPTVDVDVTSVGGWVGTVTLSAAGEPAGTSSTFVPNGQAADFTSTYTLLDTDSAATGTYALEISGLGDDPDATERSTVVVLNLAAAAPGMPAATSPADGAIGVGLLPTFSWTAASDANTYHLEVATDAAFLDIVLSATGLTGTTYDVSSALEPNSTYFWRVTADNLCGDSVSATSSFATVQVSCETYVSTDVPKAIPEGGGTSGVTVSTLSVADSGTIVDVNVLGLVGTHTFMGDLDFNLDSPAATSVEVISRNCGTAEDFDVNLDDEAADPLPCPPTGGGTHLPSNPLAAFQGEDTAGTWTLTINDNAGGDSGQLDGWGLELCVESAGAVFSDGFESGDTSAWSTTFP